MARRKQGRELTMRKIKEILRLGLQCGLSNREISRSCNVSRSTAGKYLERAHSKNLTYSEVVRMDNETLRRIFNKNRPGWAHHMDQKSSG